MISETNIEKPVNAKRFGGDMLYVRLSENKIKGFNVFGYVLFNKDGEGLETNSSFNRLVDIENMLHRKEARGNPFEHFERTTGNYARYFECTVNCKTISTEGGRMPYRNL